MVCFPGIGFPTLKDIYSSHVPGSWTHTQCNPHLSWLPRPSCECTHCVGLLAIVPPQGCESILIEILQSKRSAGGPHFTCCLTVNTHTTDQDISLKYLHQYFFVVQVLCEITHYYIFYRQLSPPLCCEREGVFTNKQYRLDCRISIKMASQPCGGTIANPVRVMYSQLTTTLTIVYQHSLRQRVICYNTIPWPI